MSPKPSQGAGTSTLSATETAALLEHVTRLRRQMDAVLALLRASAGVFSVTVDSSTLAIDTEATDSLEAMLAIADG